VFCLGKIEVFFPRKIDVKEEDVAACAMIATATAKEHVRMMAQHIEAMYSDKRWELVLADMKTQAVKAAAATNAVDATDRLIKI
jgi:hypothetical protein